MSSKRILATTFISLIFVLGACAEVKPSLTSSAALPLDPAATPAKVEPAVEFDLSEVVPQKRMEIPKLISKIKIPKAKHFKSLDDIPTDPSLIFDVPVAYNDRVQYWVQIFQTSGRSWYTKWLERSSRYLPVLKRTLKNEGLPQDLAYLAMIESGFSAHAYSAAKAVGPWQFIRETANRYGLKVSWWIDERKDFQKSTVAAAKYLKKMYGMFNNWYLVAAGYNTGENRIKRAVERNGTNNFWEISERDLDSETRDYVPKFIAALLIAKAPEMYGFRNIRYAEPLTFEHFRVPGGTRLSDLADAIGVTPQYMEELNPELVRGYVPQTVDGHLIRIPKGSLLLVSHFIRKNFVADNH